MGNNPYSDHSEIWKSLLPFLSEDLLFESRVHPLWRLQKGVYVKREDECSFICSGSKRRKFASLIPFLLSQKIELALLIGGARSNHIVGLASLLREKQIPFQLFLKASHSASIQGNVFLRSLLESDDNIHWISSSDWAQAEEFALEAHRPFQKNIFLVPEGGSMQRSCRGSRHTHVRYRPK